MHPQNVQFSRILFAHKTLQMKNLLRITSFTIIKEKNILFAVLNFGKDTSIYKYDLTTSKTIIKYNFIGFTGCYTNIQI